MTLRTTIAASLIALATLSGCAGGSRTQTPDIVVFTLSDEARLAELQTLLDRAGADPDTSLTSANEFISLADYSLSRDERRAMLVEVQRLRNKRAVAYDRAGATLASDLVPGTYVRVFAHGAQVAIGPVEQTTLDSLFISKAAGQPAAYSWRDVGKVQARRSQSRILPSMLVGGAVGFSTGGLIGLMTGDPGGTFGNPDFVDEAAVRRGALIGTAAGVLVGGLVATLVRRDRWEVVLYGPALGTRYPNGGATVTVQL